jgi:hypothetical protein
MACAIDLRHTDSMTRLAIVFVALSLLACGGKQAEPARPTPAASHDDPSCPVLVPGTSVSVEDTDQGAALVFVTTGDVAAVRTRASELARMHGAHHAQMGQMGHTMPADGAADPHAGHAGHPMADGPSGGGMAMAGGELGTMISVHSTAATTEVPGGARVTFTAADASDVAKLQAELRMHAQHLTGGTCAM